METDFFPPSGFGKIAIYVNENGGVKYCFMKERLVDRHADR